MIAHSCDTRAPFRWVLHAGARHAVSVANLGGRTTKTLCGLTMTLPSQRLGCEPECQDCDDEWRRQLGERLRRR
jgi:hypothetical protein